MCVSPAHPADVTVLGAPGIGLLGAAHLQAGAGTDFSSPVTSDVLIAVLTISNTGGANWNLKVAGESNGAPWPSDVSIALKRSGGSAEAGITDGLSYLAVTGVPKLFFSGTGDYETVEIFLRLDGLTVATSHGFYSLKIRYSIEVP